MDMINLSKVQSVLLQTLGNMTSLQKHQRDLKETLHEVYPNLMSRDARVMLNKTDRELNVLLSSSVKYKTGRFLLPAEGAWKKKLVLTRNPGLKVPHCGETEVWFSECKVLRDFRLIGDSSSTCSKLEVDFSGLVNNPGIDQEKLRKFFSFLTDENYLKLGREIHSLCRSHVYYSSVLDTAPKLLRTGSYEIGIFPEDRCFTLGFKRSNSPTDSPKFDVDWWQAREFGRFIETESYDDKILLAKNWSEIHKALLELDKKKGQLLDRVENLQAKVRQENKVFRILNKLTS